MNNNVLLSTFQYEIKKSKFLSFAYSIDTIEAVAKIFQDLKKEHKKARHVCYGYKINNQIKKGFDDGEPKGTASLPILNAIDKFDQNNIVIFVVRYFGNIKLGVGGLYRSYSKSAMEVLKNL